ncbi:MAG: hypothetical protein Q9183_003041 [Haloplaca sp. 2 TL-2023]
MSAAVAKMLAKKYAKEHGTLERFALAKDPYFVTREDGTVTNHKRKDVPLGISSADAKVLLAVRRRSYRLDNSISICGLRFGLSSLVGLIPALGDFIDVFFALMVYLNCSKVGLDARTKQKMAFNIALDFVIGLTPVLGDVADALFKANTKNLVELEKFLIKKGQKNIERGNKISPQSSAEATPVRPDRAGGRSDRVEMQQQRHDHRSGSDAPPRYESPNGRAPTGSVREPARTQTGNSSRSGRGWYGGRRERERDIERGEALPPQQPPRQQQRTRNEF